MTERIDKADPAPPQRTEIFTVEEIAAAISHFRLEPKKNSPFHSIKEAASPDAMEGLDKRGLLTPEWRLAFSKLCAPRKKIRTVVPSPAETAVCFFYSSGDEEFAGCWYEEGQGIRITLPLTTEIFLEQANSALAPLAIAYADPFRAKLSAPSLTALFTIIDALRKRMLASILERSGHVDLEFKLDELKSVLNDGLEGTDARWLVTLLWLTAPPGLDLEGERLDSGLQELAELKHLEKNGDAFIPGPDIRRMAAFWKNPLPAISHEITIFDQSFEPAEAMYITALRGDGPVFIMDFYNPSGDRSEIAFYSELGDIYIEMLNIMIGQRAEGKTQKGSSASGAAKEKFCPECGVKREDGNKFCAECGYKFKN
jgi:hypothetical protein